MINNFVPLNPLEYAEPLHDIVLLLNAFVEEGLKLRDEYMIYLHTHNQTAKLKRHKDRVQVLFDVLVAEPMLKLTPNLKDYVYQVYDYAQGLMRDIDLIEEFD